MLTKQPKINIADSNIANLGSELEKKVKLAAAETEQAWQGVGKEEGIKIWRIEKFKVVEWPKDRYGSFFSGDSYIILRTYKKTPEAKAFSYDVHFWLGSETTQDEAGTAAYKTVELDDFLRGVPVQHREVQTYESPLFLSYFPRYSTMEGGVETGFKHVKPEEYRPRLLHVKGAKNRVSVREVPKDYTSLNSGDVYILDAGLKIYQFNGAKSNVAEKHKGAEVAKGLVDERKGQPKIEIFDEHSGNLDGWWDALGSKGPIKPAEEGGDDKQSSEVKRLLRLSDKTGKMEFTVEAEGRVPKSKLDTNDVFVFDAGFEVFVWIGRKATKEEKRKGLQYAQDYLVKYKRPFWMPISRIMEGGENEVFESALDPEVAPGRNFTIPKKA